MRIDQSQSELRGRPITRIHSQRVSLKVDLGELWRYRSLAFFLVWRDIKVKYKQTAIGAGWAVLQPVITMLLFSVVFGQVANLPTAGLPGPVFYFSGLILWIYFAAGLNSATNALVNNQALVTKIYFPRLLLPLSGILSGLVDFLIASVILLAIIVGYEVSLTWAALLAPAFFILTTGIALGVGLCLASLNAVLRDVRHALPFLLQVWMFASLVVFSRNSVPPSLDWVVRANPMATVIQGFRWALTGAGEAPSVANIVFLLASLACLLLVGVFLFQRTESHVVDVI